MTPPYSSTIEQHDKLKFEKHLINQLHELR